MDQLLGERRLTVTSGAHERRGDGDRLGAVALEEPREEAVTLEEEAREERAVLDGTRDEAYRLGFDRLQRPLDGRTRTDRAKTLPNLIEDWA